MIELILEFVFWFAVFFFIRKHMSAKAEQQLMHRNELIKQLNETTHIVKWEKHGDVEYWFDSDDDTFLAQGKSLDELIDHCKSRFPTHSFFLVKNDSSVARISGPEWKPLTVNISVNLPQS